MHRMPDGSYFITRYDDCETLYKDARTYSSDKKIEFFPKYGDTPLFEHHTTSLVFNDPPLHTHVRRAIAGALSPRAIAEMEIGLIELVDRLLAQIERKGQCRPDRGFRLRHSGRDHRQSARRAARRNADRLRGWSLAILGALEPVLTQEQTRIGNEAVRDFLSYLKILTDDRRRKPGDPDKDVLTRLINGEHEGRKLTETELLQNCIFILNAGHETTTNLIGNALYTFLQFPEEKKRAHGGPVADEIGC